MCLCPVCSWVYVRLGVLDEGLAWLAGYQFFFFCLLSPVTTTCCNLLPPSHLPTLIQPANPFLLLFILLVPTSSSLLFFSFFPTLSSLLPNPFFLPYPILPPHIPYTYPEQKNPPRIQFTNPYHFISRTQALSLSLKTSHIHKKNKHHAQERVCPSNPSRRPTHPRQGRLSCSCSSCSSCCPASPRVSRQQQLPTKHQPRTQPKLVLP